MNDINKLVEKIKSGDRKAFEEMYRLTAAELFWYCRRLCGNDSDAEDILQDTYLIVWKKIHGYTENNFNAWLHSIAHNLWIDTLKKRKFEIADESVFSESADDDFFNPHNQAEMKNHHEKMMEIIDSTLNDIQRMTVLMYYYDQKSLSEIAKETNTTENAVKCRLRRAREKLKDVLQNNNIHSLPLPAVFRFDAKSADFPDILNLINKNISHKITISALKLPCIISVISIGTIIIGTTLAEVGLPTEHKAVDNSVLEAAAGTTSSEHTSETTISQIFSSQANYDNTEASYTNTETTVVENTFKEENDMNKAVNTIVSTVSALAVITSGSLITETYAETLPESIPQETTVSEIDYSSIKTADKWHIREDGIFDDINIPTDVPIRGAKYDEIIFKDEEHKLLGGSRQVMSTGAVYFKVKDGCEVPDVADLGLPDYYEIFESNWVENGYGISGYKAGLQFQHVYYMTPYLSQKLLENENIEVAMPGFSVTYTPFTSYCIFIETTDGYELTEEDFGDISIMELYEYDTNQYMLTLSTNAFKEKVKFFDEIDRIESFDFIKKVKITGSVVEMGHSYFEEQYDMSEFGECCSVQLVPHNLLQEYEYIEKDVYIKDDGTLLKADFENFCFNEVETGDANTDGSIDIKDVTDYARHIVKLSDIKKYAENVADINNDLQIDIKDLTLLKKYLIQETDSLN